MTEYRVEITGWVEATFVRTVEASDETEAQQRAIELAPTQTRKWTVLPSGGVKDIEVFAVDASKTEEQDDTGDSLPLAKMAELFFGRNT
jgi:hypothetical protein